LLIQQAAARVGMTAESAYRLRRMPGADSFAAAWASAHAHAVQILADCAFERAIELQQLSKSLESLAKADHASMSRIYTIRKEERLEMAAKFEKSAIKRGISAETIQGIRAEILGLDDDA
jgi:Protein of unknown function (DUF3486)